MTRISLGWTCSSYFGWGVYCLNLALQWSKRKEIEAQSIFPVQAAQIEIDALARRSLLPFFERSGRDIPADLYIAALGNNCETSIVRAVKGPKIGAMFFEWPFSKEAIAATKEYDLIIVGSRWNEHVLRSYGVDNVCTILQGVDPSLFHPGPNRGLYPGKFLIFSGGKTEPRKGQDLVVNAFRIFAEKHPDAVLVTAWHSPRRMTQGMDLDVRKVADRVIDVGAVPNALMAPIYRECDVALFPNRAEGGTNLVAMECIACGVPTILSANTGHMDLIERNAAYSLKRRTIDADGWGESDIDEIIETLDLAKRVPWHPKTNNPIADLTWASSSATARACGHGDGCTLGPQASSIFARGANQLSLLPPETTAAREHPRRPGRSDGRRPVAVSIVGAGSTHDGGVAVGGQCD